MNPDDPYFPLFRLLHGYDPGSPLRVGRIPRIVANKLGWGDRSVYCSFRDAQKIVHHEHHGMNASRGLHLPLVIEHGDYYRNTRRGGDLDIEVLLHEENPARAYFLVPTRDRRGQGIFLRTFYFNASLSRNKVRNSEVLLKKSDHVYFKR